MATVITSPLQDVRQRFDDLNRRKRAPGISDTVRDSAAPVFIFNVYNREHRVEVGGNYGRVTIPACPPGERVSRPVSYGGKPYIQGLLSAEYDMGTGDGQMGVIWERGPEVALDIVGIGSSNAAPGLYTTDRSNWGVFISKTATRENPVPSDDEIAEARRKLTENMMIWFNDGQRLAKEGHIDQIGPNHRDAAEFLNQKVDWSAKSIPMGVCQWCQEPMKPNARQHACGAVYSSAGEFIGMWSAQGVIPKDQLEGAPVASPVAAVPEAPVRPAAGPVPGKPIRQQ